MTTIPMLSDEELHTLAVNFVQGRVWFGSDEETLQPFVLLMGAPGFDYPENLGIVYEYIDKAFPRSINGQPLFHSMKFLAEADRVKLIEKVEPMVAALAYKGGE